MPAALHQDVTNESRSGDDERKGDSEEEDADKRRCRDDPVLRTQSASCHPEQCLDNDDEHCGLDADERSLDELHMAEKRIGDAEREHDHGAGEHEEQPCDKSAECAMQQPADINR